MTGRDEGRRGVTRRKVLAGGLLAIGTSSALASGRTGALFQDSESGSGTTQVAALDRAVYDYSSDEYDAQYQIEHRVTMDSGFDRVDVTVRNDATGSVVQTYTNQPKDGSVTFTNGANDTNYAFEFDVYATNSTSNPVMSEVQTDRADGSHPGDNDPISNPPVDPVLDQFTVIDNSSGFFNPTIDYEVTYQASNTSGFNGFVRVHFEDLFRDAPSGTGTNSTVSNGTVAYPHNGYTASWISYFEITVEIVRNNGIVVDFGRVEDLAGGDGASWPEDSTTQSVPTRAELEERLPQPPNGTQGGGNVTTFPDE